MLKIVLSSHLPVQTLTVVTKILRPPRRIDGDVREQFQIAFCAVAAHDGIGRRLTQQRIPANLVVLALFIGSILRWFAMMATSTTATAAISSVMPKIGLCIGIPFLLLEQQQVRSTLLKDLELGYRRIDCASALSSISTKMSLMEMS